ncbi:MAG: EI24 domain-containing protein [Bacteroidota bacterium]
MIGLFNGFVDYFRALGAINRHNLWRQAMIPGFVGLGVGILVFSVLGFVGGYLVDALFNGICGIYPQGWWGHDSLCNVTSWISESWIGEILGWLLSLILNVLMFRYIVIIALAPFLGGLSEQVELKETGALAAPMTGKETMSSIVRGLKIVFRNLFRELFWTLALTVVGLFVPGIGSLITTALIFLISSFYAGFGNMDAMLDRRRVSLSDSVAFARKNRGLSIGNGIPFLLLMFIPYLGWFLGPVLGIVAGTLSYLRKEGKAE